MRIFFASPSSPNQWGLPESTLWHANLYQPLVELGHEVVMFDFDFAEANNNLDPEISEQRAFIASSRPLLSEALLRQFNAVHEARPIDLFFSYFYSAFVEPSAIREISSLGVPTMNWYCNASYQLRLVEEIAPAYDWCLVPEYFRLEDYRRIGANPIYCQEAANPSVYRPYDLPYAFDVTFVGQRYGDRPAFLRALLDAGLDARAWGPSWQEPPAGPPAWRRAAGHLKRSALRRPQPPPDKVPADRCGPPLSDLEYVQMYSRSRISLGFTKVAEGAPGETSIRQVRLRDFEAPMSGAFYLVERCEELEDFFEPDREIVFFEGREELVEKASYYLAHDEEREQIRRAGLARAHRDHTWQARFRQVFAEMGLG
jgi:spore maturation protein CgeB